MILERLQEYLMIDKPCRQFSWLKSEAKTKSGHKSEKKVKSEYESVSSILGPL